MDLCKLCKDLDPKLYIYYFCGYFMPLIRQMKDKKQLTVGTKEISYGTYTGTLDEKGNAFGEGKVGKWTGTFMNNKLHGFGKCL